MLLDVYENMGSPKYFKLHKNMRKLEIFIALRLNTVTFGNTASDIYSVGQVFGQNWVKLRKPDDWTHWMLLKIELDQ